MAGLRMKLKTQEYIAVTMWVIGGSLLLTGVLYSNMVKFICFSNVMICIGLPLFSFGMYWNIEIVYKYVVGDTKQLKESFEQITKLTFEDVKETTEIIYKMSVLSKMSDADFKRLMELYNKMEAK